MADETYTLNDGQKIPKLGLGTSPRPSGRRAYSSSNADPAAQAHGSPRRAKSPKPSRTRCKTGTG